MNDKLDKSNLKQVILDTSKQFQAGFNAADNITPNIDSGIKKEKFDSLIICGLGGSAMPGYLLKSLPQVNFLVQNHLNYGLPRQRTSNPLIFVSSFSGSTEETLSSYKQAKKESLKIITFSNGGTLYQTSQNDNIPAVNYRVNQPGFQPRWALPTSFSAMTKILENLGLITGAVKSLQETSHFLKTLDQEEIQKQAQIIVKKIKTKIPIYYADYSLRFTALINKIKINENSKFPAFCNYYPELNHNEYNGFLNGDPEKFIILSLDNPGSLPKNQKRMRLTNEILQTMNYEIINIPIKGQNRAERIFHALIFGDWISYYLALSLNQDPSPVELVEKLKQKLKNQT
ncbi:MAG: SIS domain-containing protein [Patescibacteria group bacterium]|nr:hypothetical protein [Patescibacteria group bacterium]